MMRRRGNIPARYNFLPFGTPTHHWLMECVQGTWQFISISRLRDSSTTPHQVSDDLESFFWVLLYLVVKCRNITREDLSENMKDVFDQHSDMDRNGNVTGGNGKLLFLHNRKFDKTLIRALVNTPCRKII